ncbi:FHA domain-containing protein [Fimbriiglobus ruber]|uniref:OmpA domain protein n=1 Tax=Fimbriiglobus ruber TaxID=1908690 RepID=A0A225D0L2_9BACT|nr:FHA domain-containing protein [Fimbriiglobus ruber]OWK34473.1 OmpA domain protein [Fimbriiglobus ruber]
MSSTPLPNRWPKNSAAGGTSWARLDVRFGTGRPVGYALDGDLFRIGGAAAAEVRIPGAGIPPLVCQFFRAVDELWLRRLDPAYPIFLNGESVPGSTPIRVGNGDRVSAGPVEVTVATVVDDYLRPEFVPATPPSTRTTTEPDERDDLARLRAQLDAEAQALDAERAEWLRHREEIEAEGRRVRDLAAGTTAREHDLARRETAVANMEQELARVRDELSSLRENLNSQYHERREQLAQMQDVVRGATATLHERRQQFEADSGRQRQDLDAREARLGEQLRAAVATRLAELETDFRTRQEQLDAEHRNREATTSLVVLPPSDTERALKDRETEVAARAEQLRADRDAYRAERDRHADDLVRLDRWQATLDDRQRELDHRAAEVDMRHDQLARESVELEEHVRLAAAEHERQVAEAARLEAFRVELEEHRGKIGNRSAQLEAQQAMLAVLRARLDRQQEDVRHEAAQLAADRARQDEARLDLESRIREAERLRADLTTAHETHAEKQKIVDDRGALLDATLADIRQQKEAVAVDQARLAARETELDARSAEIAEQTAHLAARVAQVMDLQERLETDRTSVRSRETTLADVDAARQTFQEQLRRRSDELAARAKHLDELAHGLTSDKAGLDRERDEFRATREATDQALTAARNDLAARAADLDRRAGELAAREGTLERQVARLKEVGRAVGAARKELSASRRQWEADHAVAADRLRGDREAIEAFHGRAQGDLDALRREAPNLEDRARAAVERLTAARDVLRGHLGELHGYAGQARGELDRLRADLRAEADRVRAGEQALEAARSEHRLGVAGFRQQLLEWQALVGDLKQTMARSESRIEARHAEISAAVQHADETTIALARQAEELRQERQIVTERRTEVERHLAEMREWYRRKLRELAAGRAEKATADAEPSLLLMQPAAGNLAGGDADGDLDPGDKHLGELLQSLDLVDPDTLRGLWAEATRQRRTLRNVLLASGAITLYQLALIEAGNLDRLMLGRFRVVDRVRVTSKEAVYRVFDPTRPGGPTRGVFLLRHLAEAEMEDAVRPDEFRQMFAAAASAAHQNLAATLEVLEINGRPAVLQEWLAGLFSADWPADAAVPGAWVRLLSNAAAALEAAHLAGLTHGRLTADSILLTADGVLKVTGVGEPEWLTGRVSPTGDPTPETDLRALGQVAFAWPNSARHRPAAAAGRDPKRSPSRSWPWYADSKPIPKHRWPTPWPVPYPTAAPKT